MNSRVAVAMFRLLHAVARTRRNLVIGVNHKLAIGRTAHFQPWQRTRCRSADDVSAMIEARTVTGASKSLLRPGHDASQVCACRRDRIEAFLVAKQNQVLLRE